MGTPSKLPPASILLRRMRAGESGTAIARQYDASNAAVYMSLKKAGYFPVDWRNKRASVDLNGIADEERTRKREDEAKAFYNRLPKSVGAFFEMPWSDWVAFAQEIIEADKAARTKP